MHELPASLSEENRTHINGLFEWLVDPCVTFIRKNCRELVRWL